MIYIDAQDAQDFSRKRPACNPEHPQFRARPLSEPASVQEALILRQAIADTDWETVERHGGWDAVVAKVIQSEQEAAPSNDQGMIDDFHLWGSRRCRQMGVTVSDGGSDIKG